MSNCSLIQSAKSPSSSQNSYKLQDKDESYRHILLLINQSQIIVHWVIYTQVFDKHYGTKPLKIAQISQSPNF